MSSRDIYVCIAKFSRNEVKVKGDCHLRVMDFRSQEDDDESYEKLNEEKCPQRVMMRPNPSIQGPQLP